MALLQANCLRLKPSTRVRGMYEASFPFKPEGFRLALKAYPGVTYGPQIGIRQDGLWFVPMEIRDEVVALGKEWGLTVSNLPYSKILSENYRGNPALHEYQQLAVCEAIAQRRYMLNFEMGLGKTPTAIETMRLAGVKSALVICPALVRQNWADEIIKWWTVGMPLRWPIDTGVEAEKFATQGNGIGIVSYELLKKLAFEKKTETKYDEETKEEYTVTVDVLRESMKNRFGAIIIDESHYIANNRAGRAADVRAVVDANPDALLLMLTATPVTNEPKGLWFQLDTLYPHRFGTWPGFMKRYANVSSNEYTDWVVKGLNEENAAELAARLAAVSSRVTKHEVAHLLPPFSVQTLRVPPRDRSFNPRELLEKFTRMDQHRNNGEELIRAAGEQKVESAVEQVMDALGGGTTHVCVLTHLKSTAAEIAAALAADKKCPTVVSVDGNTPIARRMEELKKARGLKKCVLVATMHSVNVGIDLTAFSVCVFAELDYTPANVIQALGRFSRLSGKLPSTCILLVLAGTQDEIVASRVLSKVKDINAVIRAGQSETEVAAALEPKMDEKEFFVELRAAAMKMVDGDEYVG